MEIRFSPGHVPPDPIARVHQFAQEAGSKVYITKLRSPVLRFTVGGTESTVDYVIRALLTLDPDATVRTARATYNGKDDFERQCAARVSK